MFIVTTVLNDCNQYLLTEIHVEKGAMDRGGRERD